MVVVESWQSGNAPDSKSGEPSIPWRAGSNPVLSLNTFINLVILTITRFFVVFAWQTHSKKETI
jgi:hypothetical protein